VPGGQALDEDLGDEEQRRATEGEYGEPGRGLITRVGDGELVGHRDPDDGDHDHGQRPGAPHSPTAPASSDRSAAATPIASARWK